jgi:DNA-binding transcriptional LysR family regulator
MLTRWSLEGLGIAWRPYWEVAADLAAGRLVGMLDGFTAPHQDIVATYPPQNPLPAKVRLLVAWLKAVYARPGYWANTRADVGSTAP